MTHTVAASETSVAETIPAELLKTIANARPQLPTFVEHILHLPELCPATQNPAPGSTLTISYQAGGMAAGTV